MKPLYFHKVKNISYSQRTQQKISPILKPIVKMSIQALRGFVIRAPNRICTGICDSRTAKKYLIDVRLGLRPTYGQWKRHSLRRRKGGCKPQADIRDNLTSEFYIGKSIK